jgi:hypothetical protein
MRAAHRLFVEGDTDGAMADAREAIRLHASVGTTPVWSEVGLAVTLLLGAHPDARSELHRIVTAAYDARQWTAIDTLLELPPLVLTSDDPAAAATVFGHVEGRDAAWGVVGEQLRETIAQLVEPIPDTEAFRARGAAMDRHEIVAFTLAALAEP